VQLWQYILWFIQIAQPKAHELHPLDPTPENKPNPQFKHGFEFPFENWLIWQRVQLVPLERPYPEKHDWQLVLLPLHCLQAESQLAQFVDPTVEYRLIPQLEQALVPPSETVSIGHWLQVVLVRPYPPEHDWQLFSPKLVQLAHPVVQALQVEDPADEYDPTEQSWQVLVPPFENLLAGHRVHEFPLNPYPAMQVRHEVEALLVQVAHPEEQVEQEDAPFAE
jgi:hypothetical protein